MKVMADVGSDDQQPNENEDDKLNDKGNDRSESVSRDQKRVGFSKEVQTGSVPDLDDDDEIETIAEDLEEEIEAEEEGEQEEDDSNDNFLDSASVLQMSPSVFENRLSNDIIQEIIRTSVDSTTVEEVEEESNQSIAETDDYEMFIDGESEYDFETLNEFNTEEMMSESSANLLGYYRSYRKARDTYRSDVDATETFIFMAIPLDGGYAWIILLVAFCSMLIGDGIVFSFGLLLPSISEEFGFTEKQSAIIVSMQIGAYFMSGPMAGAIVQSKGFRPIAVGGAAIASIAFFIGSFSNGIVSIVLAYGIAGSALGCLWCCSSLIVNFYFGKLRPFAMGIATSGFGVGLTIFSGFNKSFVSVLGWRTLVRIHSAFVMLVAIMAIFYKELKPTKIGKILEKRESSSDNNHDYYEDYYDDDESNESVEIESVHYSLTLPPENVRTGQSSENTAALDFKSRLKEDMVQEDQNSKFATKKETFLEKICCSWCSKKLKKRSTVEGNNLGQLGTSEKRLTIEHNPLDREDIFYSGPPNVSRRSVEVTNILQGANIVIPHETENKTKNINYTLSVLRTTPAETKQTRFKCFHPKVVETLHLLFDPQLFRILSFQIMFLQSLLFIAGSNIIYTYATRRSRINEPYQSLILPTVGVTNVVVRILIGMALTKYTKMNTSYVCASGIFIGGFFTFISGLGGEDIAWFQLLFALAFGIAPAVFGPLRSIIYVEILGLEKLTSVFGLTSMAFGFGGIIGAGIAGALHDATGDYRAIFLFSGFCLMSAAFLSVILPCVGTKKHFTSYFRFPKVRSTK